ncbi:Hypothetical predicted protein [Mytilus galloprovincialis]|uniref:Uncharacterized protein n=1 Tax=Mytilus galloprovincialis TaxID=29158 RepID=A0A8B6F2L4_MYTGA|nr:Hypothetical predicted protein [Mytilus galloprovincialis]
MASTREKRDNAGDKLKDIIDSLKPKATKQKETHDNNEDSDSESDGEFAESFEKLTEDNDNEEINALENELKRLKTEKRKVELKRKIEEEKDNLKNLQLLPTVQPSVAALVQNSKGEQNHEFSDIIACSTEKSGKAMQIVDFLWPEPIPQYQTITLAGDMEVRVGKKKTLDKISIEEWGYANIRILQEMLKRNTAFNVNTYLNYTADIFRLASKYVWYSVLLYDKEYRDMQAEEKFTWGTYRQDLRDFQLVSKRENLTTRAMNDATKPHGK